MSDSGDLLFNVSAVAIGGRALVIEGPPGSGKSSLALALIDRGAMLIGDDGLALERDGGQLIASSPPNTSGLLEVRGVGLIEVDTAPPTPLALILSLTSDSERLPEAAEPRSLLGCAIPVLRFVPGTIAPGPRAEIALETFGLKAT